MAIFTAIIAGGAALAGDMIASGGQQQTNDTSMAIANANNATAWNRQSAAQSFNADQANLARQFSAQQVQQQEQFQRDTQQEAERYNTEMSDTSMSRRVADLKNAGLNPLLAVSQGGASTPQVSSLTGNVASAAQASSAGGPGLSTPNISNPSAAFGNLGGQLSSALNASQTAAQIDLLKAQTNKVNTEAGTEIPANVNYLKSMTGLTDQNANQAYYNTMKIQEQIYNERLTNDQLRDILTPISQQNLQVVQGTRDALISAAQSDSTAKQLNLSGLRNLSDVQQSNLGKIITYLNAILTPASSAAGIASKLSQ